MTTFEKAYKKHVNESDKLKEMTKEYNDLATTLQVIQDPHIKQKAIRVRSRLMLHMWRN